MKTGSFFLPHYVLYMCLYVVLRADNRTQFVELVRAAAYLDSLVIGVDGRHVQVLVGEFSQDLTRQFSVTPATHARHAVGPRQADRCAILRQKPATNGRSRLPKGRIAPLHALVTHARGGRIHSEGAFSL